MHRGPALHNHAGIGRADWRVRGLLAYSKLAVSYSAPTSGRIGGGSFFENISSQYAPSAANHLCFLISSAPA